MVTLTLYERGWRAGFYGREAAESDPTYLEGWQVGLRRGDRTRTNNAPEPAGTAGEGCSYEGDRDDDE